MDIPGYEIVEMLGAGGFGTVYRARQLAVRREVALKIDSRVLSTERDRRRFMREVTAAGRLSGHPHVVALYDAGTLPDGRPYMVMALCPDGSLNDRLHDSGPFPAAEVRDIGVRIADALAAAHAAGVLHRDVKPANILRDPYGGVALADFGLASMPAPGLESSATREALTPAYAPPEAFQLVEPAPVGDVYSLAASLYALLSGRPPHFPPGGPPSIPALLAAQRHPVPDVPGAPPALVEVLRRALAYDPAARTPTAAALRDALAALAPADLAGSAPVPGPRTDPGLPAPAGASSDRGPVASGPGVVSGPPPVAAAPAGSGPTASGAHVVPGTGTPGLPPPPGSPPGTGGAAFGVSPVSGPRTDPGSPVHGTDPSGRGAVFSPGHAPGPPPVAGPPAPAPGAPWASPSGPGTGGYGAQYPGGEHGGWPGPQTRPPGGWHGTTSPGRPARQGIGRGVLLSAAALVAAAIVGAGALVAMSDRGDGEPGTGAASGGASPGAGNASRPAANGGYGVPTVTENCPAAGVQGAQARCTTTAECWGGMVVISGDARATRYDCVRRHSWETFAIGLLPADAQTWNQQELAQHPLIRQVCSKQVLLASRKGAGLRHPVAGWRPDVLPPSQASFENGNRVYRCVAAHTGLDGLQGTSFHAS
ncbi:serine/threonine protein kinase [Actinomadura craniellae]|uniref:non-specific serine/threonine protein kinase n=1 Tax=Actinomadura craniellae TaxID=2231787 RepID=A0A365H9H0_9ACTN|nr:serine/threonine-protein kinase [Actinomadura craniellae]RAY15648.1 serine/threonine protein kinase [Actinomadura craniellae]